MNVDQISNKFRDVAEHNVAASYISQQTYEVDMLGSDCLIDQFAKVEYSAINAEVTRTGGVVTFSENDFVLFCRQAVITRVHWVLGEKYLTHPNDKIMIPSFLMNIIMQIGLAYEVRLGITLKPKAGLKDVLTIDKVREISFFLRSIKSYDGGLGYLKDKTGVWDFMSMTLVNNQIQRYNADAHPVFALMASVVGPKLVQSVLSPLVRYGDMNFFEGLLWELTTV